MGKANQGVFGSFYNKVGNVVGRVRKGEQIYSIYQPKVANPKTDAQKAARKSFTLISKLSSAVDGVIPTSFKSAMTKGQTAYNAFFKENYSKALTGNYPGITIDYTKVVVGKGVTTNVSNPTKSYDDAAIEFSWSDNSGTGKAKGGDRVFAVLFNPSKEECNYKNMGSRSDRVGEIACPASWQGDTVHVYLFCCSVSSGINDIVESGDSVYLGSQVIS